MNQLVVYNHDNFRKGFGDHGAVPALETEIRPGIPDLGQQRRTGFGGGKYDSPFGYMGRAEGGINGNTAGIALVDVIDKCLQSEVTAFFSAAASTGGMIAEAVQNRTDHLPITASTGQDGTFHVAVQIDTENDGAVPVGAQDFAVVLRQQCVQIVVPEDMLPAGEKQKVHQEPGEETPDECNCLYENRMPYDFLNHGIKEKAA